MSTRSPVPTGVTPDVDEWLTSLPHATTLRELVSRCTAAGLTVATAESFTAGLLASAIAAEPDSGRVFLGSVVTYSSETKRRVLGVRPGPVVHPDAAADMAIGAVHVFGCDLAVATTGVAGPAPQDGQPPGTVVIAVAERDGPDGRVRVCRSAVYDVGRATPGRVRALGVALAAEVLLAAVERRTSRHETTSPSDATTLTDVGASYAVDGWDADLDVVDDGSAVAQFFTQAVDGRGHDDLDPAAAPQDQAS